MSDGNGDEAKRLWCAVILQALSDAVRPLDCQRSNRNVVRDQARNWLLKPNKHFEFVCGCADLDPSQVRQYARELIDGDECDINTLRMQRKHMRRPRTMPSHARPGVVQDFQEGGRDRRGSVSQDCAEIEFSQNTDSPSCR